MPVDSWEKVAVDIGVRLLLGIIPLALPAVQHWLRKLRKKAKMQHSKIGARRRKPAGSSDVTHSTPEIPTGGARVETDASGKTHPIHQARLSADK